MKANSEIALSPLMTTAFLTNVPVGPRVVFDKPDDNGTPDPNKKDEDDKTADDKTSEDDKKKTEDKEKTTDDKTSEDDKDKKKSSDKMSDDAANLLKENMAKKKEIKELKDRLASFDGIDPEKVRDLIKQNADKEKADAEAKGEFDRVKQMMVEEHKKELGTVKEQLTAKDQEIAKLKGSVDELTIGQAFATSKIVTEDLVVSPAKARQLYGSHFEMTEEGLVAYDKPKGAGERTQLVDGNGVPMSFEAAMARIIESDPDKDTLLKSKIKPGGNSKTTDKDVEKKPEKVKGVERIKLGLANKDWGLSK